MSHLFGPVRQLGFVVNDIEQTIDHWLNTAGCGPVFRARATQIGGYRYRGAPAESPDISVVYVQDGPMQMEFLALNNDAPSSWRDFLATGSEGLHHLGYWTTSFERHLELALARGLEPEMTGETGPGERFAVFAPKGPRSMVLELVETSPRKQEFYRQIAAASEGWDGKDPIRQIDRRG